MSLKQKQDHKFVFNKLMKGLKRLPPGQFTDKDRLGAVAKAISKKPMLGLPELNIGKAEDTLGDGFSDDVRLATQLIMDSPYKRRTYVFKHVQFDPDHDDDYQQLLVFYIDIEKKVADLFWYECYTSRVKK